ncbi:concanavalin A-like lectin/glucanase [Testicularia cyperi]|uniref:Concanavalin A-like lectin/glucanase n=1 Tax=Testicularia cyperi TaxID=1882483 RepID=A0A317XWR3_9BASI|nr:concanavalin A-like lectin/glucanase [Testicularia cyperi]
MARLTWLLLALVLASVSVVRAATCSSSSQCPSSAPCCSEYGYCGSSALHCTGGCDPLGSFKHSSCSPMPKCQPMTVSFVNSAKPYVSVDNYKGDPTQAPFTLDVGTVVPSKTGLKMLLTKTGDAKKGTKLSTTRYMYYGTASAVMKHGSWAGVVHTFIGMSNTRDEIDWEFTTDSPQDVQTNWYWFGQAEGWTHGYIVPSSKLDAISAGFKVSDWHTYTVDWNASRLKWLIDGVVVRTLYRKNTLNKKDGLYHYPSSPVRLQLSIWGAGDGTYANGTVEWAGGLIDWNQANSNGQFINTVKSFSITCNDPADVQDSKPNYMFSAKSTNSQNGQPKVLSTTKSSIVS